MEVAEEAVELVPQERVRQPIVEPTPVPLILKEAFEVVKLVSRERVQQQTVEHVVDEPNSTNYGKKCRRVKIVPHERISERICGQSGVIEVSKISSQDRIFQCTKEQILDEPVVQRHRVQQRTAEQIVKLLIPPIAEDSVEEFKKCTTGAFCRAT